MHQFGTSFQQPGMQDADGPRGSQVNDMLPASAENEQRMRLRDAGSVRKMSPPASLKTFGICALMMEEAKRSE